jgi:hypothetical protein
MERILIALEDAADWIDRIFSTSPDVNSSELHFDSDAYLAEIRNRVFTRYY